MKVILAFLLIGMMFVPGTAFGWKSISSMYESNCDFACAQSSNNYFPAPMNFILLGLTAFAVLGLYVKFTKTGRYETFSLKCKQCGRLTNGLKCPICETYKQKAR